MKQFYPLCLSIFLMNAIAIGQGDSPSNYLTQYDSTRIKKMRPLGQDRAADDIVWEDGFDDAGVWTAAGPSGDYEVSGWSIGSTTNGWYFGTDDDIGTEGNFARFINGDPSEEPDPIEDGPFTLTYALPIDLTGIPAPHVEFEQYGARFYTLQGIQISIDGGTSWETVGTNDDIRPLTFDGGSLYGQPESRRFNISEHIADDPSNVMIRLYWDGATNYLDEVKKLILALRSVQTTILF